MTEPAASYVNHIVGAGAATYFEMTPGANSDTYQLTKTGPDANGQYTCSVTNGPRSIQVWTSHACGPPCSGS